MTNLNHKKVSVTQRPREILNLDELTNQYLLAIEFDDYYDRCDETHAKDDFDE